METITNDLFSFDLMGQYGTDFVLSLSMQVIAGILTIFIGFWLSGRASRLVIKAFSKIDQIDKTIIPMIGALVRYAGMTLTLVVALGKFGVETTSIIAVLGAAGLAIGLALQGTLSNVAAGLMLIFLRPFKIGDWVEAAGMSGTVREIGLFTTVIDTLTVFSSVYPIHQFGHQVLSTTRGMANAGWILISELLTRVALMMPKAALLKLANDERVLATPPPRFLVVSYADSAIIVRLRVYANYADFFDLQYDLHRKLKDISRS